MASLSFCGAAGTVTGSCSLIESDQADFLIDCGLFQGNRTTRDLNFQEFPFDAKRIDFLLLTHAHIDHSGLLPKLVKAGFTGPIYATRATADLLEFMLPDSASIQESNAERLNKKRERRGASDIVPIYTMEDAEQTLKQLMPMRYEAWFEPKPGISARFWNAGHILGSASIEVKMDEKDSNNILRLLFSGDLGPDEKVFHSEPGAPTGFDYIVCESTYGNRERDDYTIETRRAVLREELTEGLNRGGNIVIPSFAVERSQELLHDIGVLLARKEIPPANVYLDSPLARKVTQVFIKYASTFDDIDLEESELFRNEHFRLVETVEESKAVNRIKKGAIIISASGMADAGRIQHHIKANIWRPESTILFVGYQSPGTLGSIITSGAEDVKIHGELYKVKASIRRMGNYSAHADQSELVDWIMERAPVSGGLFLNHGEDKAREVLRDLLGRKGIDPAKIYLPKFDEKFALTAGAAESKGRGPQRIDESAMERDWYNDYAAFILELANRLEKTKDTHKRRDLIARLAAAIDSD